MSPHREKLERLLHQTQPRLASRFRVEFKNVFGATGGYVSGRIFVSCGKFGLALKLPPRTINELLEKESGVKYLKYFTKGHVKKDYLILPERIIADKVRFRELVNKSVRFVLGL
jgi:hypothetical protein